MIEDIKNFKINWIDGMKISKEHFLSLQDFAENQVKDAYVTRKGRHGYGLLTPHTDGNKPVRVMLDQHEGLSIELERLRAVTPNGSRIEITPQMPKIGGEKAFADLTDNKLGSGYLVINLDAGNPVAFGEQDPKEVPPRHPFLTHHHFFSFVSDSELINSGIGGNQLPIAKIIEENGNLTAAADYIPPSMSLDAHPALIDFYSETANFLKMTERNTVSIVQKIRSKQKSENPISDAMFIAVDKLYVYLAQQITKIKWEQYDLHPKDLLETIVSFSRILKDAVDSISPENKEQLFNYFGEWSDMKGGDYEKLFSGVINLEYNHLDLRANLKVVTHFMDVVDRLFTVLTQVDYIGKRRDMGIFVHENKVNEKSGKAEKVVQASGPSFLAE